jgi:hypothetical protein
MSEFYDNVDVDGDGQEDRVQVDTDSRGNTEYLIDTNHDNVADYEVHADADGNVTEVAYDSDSDGTYDIEVSDTNDDGRLDHAVVDTDHDGRADYEGAYNGYASA